MSDSLLHRIVAIPQIYNAAQFVAGARLVQKRLKQSTATLKNAHRVLDLGGGTGLHRELWSRESAYICLDSDPQKLQGFRARHEDGLAILGDATRVPMRDNTLDVVICTSVSHHIPDELFQQFVSEAMRVLKNDGHFVFLDAVWQPRRPVARLLWKYDRGSFPRSSKALRKVLSQHGTVIRAERFAVLHEYLLCVVTKSAL